MALNFSVESMKVELVSPLPIGEFCRLLRAKIGFPLAIFESRPVVGRVSGTSFYARKRIRYQNPYQTRLTAEMTDLAGQTHIRCCFAIHPLVRAFMILWLAISAISGVLILPVLLFNLATIRSEAPSETWLSILISVGLPAFGFGQVRLGRYLARDERRFLIAFICETVEANQQAS